MASTNDLKGKFAEIKARLVNQLPEIAATLAVSAKAVAERRILSEGFGRTYSENRIPAWYLDGKELNAAGTVYLKNKKKQDQKNTHVQDGVTFFPQDYGVNWKEFRNAQGLPTEHVDLHYSNRMFSNMNVAHFQYSSDGTHVIAFLGATNIEDQKKMDYNRDRYGDFIRQSISKEDDDALRTVAGDEVRKIINGVNL
jgi:hypothetical protein